MSDQSSPNPTEPLAETPAWEDDAPVLDTEALSTQNFTEMSLWEVLQFAIFRPGTTLPEFFKVLWGDDSDINVPRRPQSEGGPPPFPTDFKLPNWWRYIRIVGNRFFDWEYVGRVIWLLLSWFPMLIGARALFNAATDPIRHTQGDYGSSVTWFELSIMIYLLGYMIFSRDKWLPLLNQYLPSATQDDINQFRPTETDSDEEDFAQDDLEQDNPDESPYGLADLYEEEPALDDIDDEPKQKYESVDLVDVVLDWFTANWMRLILVPVALILSWLAYDKNVAVDPRTNAVIAVLFTRSGLASWIGAVALWYIIFVVDLNRLVENLLATGIHINPEKFKLSNYFRWRYTYTLLIFIVFLGAYFRMHDLDAVPSDMTSDHIEMMGDALRVNDGEYSVFFPNNGGRESVQMYIVKLIANDLGAGFNFRALKYATVTEGLLAIVLLFFMVKTMFGNDTAENERLGDLVGLAASALLAISSWHTMMSRLGLRIPLTPIAAILVTIFLIRAIRNNRRVDFVHMGIILGVGMYWYQSDRMLPFVAIPIVGLAVLFSFPRWGKMSRYIINFAMAGIIALTIYLPMYRYSVEFPGEFWSRGYGRIFGDFVYGYCDYDETTGRYQFCGPTTQELVEHLWNNRDILQDNYENAFLMFGWEGDPAWFHNGKGYPAMDPVTNALLMLGAAMWILFALRKRKIIYAIVPIGIVVMMIPSILAIAPTAHENPAFTRISGIMPFVFLLAGFPVGVLANEIIKAGYSRSAFYVPAILIGFLFINSAIPQNYETYFTVYRESYEYSWKPYKQISEPLQNFAEGEGSFGNAFYVHTPHWLDHRIVGAMAGDNYWPNSLIERDVIYQRMQENQGTPYEYDPEKPLLFMINLNDQASVDFFQERFPGGELRIVKARNNNDFYVYTVPAGYDWLAQYATAQTQRFACITNCGLMR